MKGQVSLEATLMGDHPKLDLKYSIVCVCGGGYQYICFNGTW